MNKYDETTPQKGGPYAVLLHIYQGIRFPNVTEIKLALKKIVPHTVLSHRIKKERYEALQTQTEIISLHCKRAESYRLSNQ